ncbi:MAG: hypothetical protein LBD01_01460 [Puniceicoccales bacterium]|nr:hypothetical protein [Puniceicoccales bacterium]
MDSPRTPQRNSKLLVFFALFLAINAMGWAVFLARQGTVSRPALPRALPAVPGTPRSLAKDALQRHERQSVREAASVAFESKKPEVVETQKFRLMHFRAEQGFFDAPEVRLYFNKNFKSQDFASHVTCTPAVAFAVEAEASYSGAGQLSFHGAFAPGKSYRFSVDKDLMAEDGTRLGAEQAFSVVIPWRAPHLKIDVEGRYIPPGGDYLLPVKSVNVSQIKARVFRVPVQNIVQFAAREAGLYKTFWDGDAGEDAANASELGTEVREHIFPLKLPKDRVGISLLDLGESLPESRRGVFAVLLKGAPLPGSTKTRGSGDDEGDSAPGVDERLLCLSDIGLSAQHSGSALLVWATSLSQGKPLAGVTLKLYQSNNLIASTTTTDAQGLARLPFAARDGAKTDGPQPFLLVASTADESDSTFLSIRPQTLVRTINKGGRHYLAQGECEAFVFSDRGIYRHGDPILAQVLLRDDAGKAPASFPLTLELCKPGGAIFKTFPLMPDAQGAAVPESELAIPEAQPSGQWALKVRVPGKKEPIGTHHFVVETFVPPQIRVAVKALPKQVEDGKALTFKIGSEFLFGRPAASLNAEATVVFADAPFEPKGWEGYTFGRLGEGKSVSRVIRLPAKRLGESGEAEFQLDPLRHRQGLYKPAAAVKATVEGTVFDPGGRPVSARCDTIYHAHPFYIGLRSEGFPFVQSGIANIFRVAAVRVDGTRYAEPGNARVVLNKLSVIHNYRKEGNRYEWTVETIRQPVSTQEIQLLADADASLSLHVPSEGRYELHVVHTGSQVGSSLVFHAARDAVGLAAARADSADSPVEILFEKESAVPGEVLQGVVKSPVAGMALVTLRNARYEHAFTLLVEVGEPAAFPMLITDVCYPSVDVSVVVVRPVKPVTTPEAWRAHRFLATRTLPVLRPQGTLHVALLTTVRIVDGGSIVNARVDVQDADVKALKDGFVTLMLVDEGILTLTKEPLPSPAAFFAAPRHMPVNVHDVFGKLFPVLKKEPLVLSTDAVAGGGGESSVLRRMSPVLTRRFKPLAFWSSCIPVKNGLAEASFSLPEFSGEVRVTAVAWTANASGSAKLQVEIKPQIVAKADAPRFLASGDSAGVSLAIYNESDRTAEVEVHAKVSGAGSFAEGQGGIFKMVLEAGTTQTLRQRIVAALSPGCNHAIVSFTVQGCGEKHVERIEIPVRPALPWERQVVIGSLQPGAEKLFSIPETPYSALATHKVRLSKNPGVELEPALRYLTEYPYGCLEQTTSSVFPLVFAHGEVAKVLGGDSDFKKLSEGFVEAALERLTTMRRGASFTTWPGNGDTPLSNAPVEHTLYAMRFIAEASRVGFKIPSQLRDIQDSLRWEILGDSRSSLRARAHACHVLASRGLPEANAMFRLKDDLDKFDVCALAHLSRAFALASNLPDAASVAERIKLPATVEELSLSVLAMLEVRPDAPQVLEWLSRLASLRDPRTGRWKSTWENAHALQAFAAYSRRNASPQGLFSYELTADNGAAMSGGPTSAIVAEFKGGSWAKLKNTGNTPIYFSVETRAIPALDMGAAENGVRVCRRFYDLDGEPLDASALRTGQTLVVGLELELLNPEEPLDDVVVQELLPACFEVQPGAILKEAPWKPSHNWLVNVETRDDRVLIFGKLSKPLSRVFYRANVVSPGEFVLPAPFAEDMYRPEYWARGKPGNLKIGE